MKSIFSVIGCCTDPGGPCSSFAMFHMEVFWTEVIGISTGAIVASCVSLNGCKVKFDPRCFSCRASKAKIQCARFAQRRWHY